MINKISAVIMLGLIATTTAHALPDPLISVYMNTPSTGLSYVGSADGFYAFALANGTDSANITITPDTSLSVTATNTGEWTGGSNYGGSSEAILTYYMEFCLPTCGVGIAANKENILVNMNANTMISAWGAGSARASVSIVDDNYVSNYAWAADSGSNIGIGGVETISNTSNIAPSIISLYSNTVYTVKLDAQVYANSINQPFSTPIASSVSASVDPTFSFAPGSGVSNGTFIFSQGVGNELLAMPSPSAWLLFASGLLGIVGLRKKH